MTEPNIKIDREALTIMDVKFPDLEILEITALALNSGIFIDYHPTKKNIEVILNYCMGHLTLAEVRAFAKNEVMEH
jgi:hypothetical protein